MDEYEDVKLRCWRNAASAARVLALLGSSQSARTSNEITAQTSKDARARRRHRRGCPQNPAAQVCNPNQIPWSGRFCRDSDAAAHANAAAGRIHDPRSRRHRAARCNPRRRGCIVGISPSSPSPVPPFARERRLQVPPRTPHSSAENGTPKPKPPSIWSTPRRAAATRTCSRSSSRFWTDAVECRTPFAEALRRTDPARWRLVRQHMKQFTAIRGLLLAEVAERATGTHATRRPRSESRHFAPSPAQ